nr:immunoglobulin heavy chain junction region [Macaca mulatta]
CARQRGGAWNYNRLDVW